MENWPITVVQAPANSEAQFNQDIVVRFKASERGTPAIMEPRRIDALPRQQHEQFQRSHPAGRSP